MGFKNTRLWTDALEARPEDPHCEEREMLRQQLLNMRSKVAQLVSHIPNDCRGLTVHDISHLDAMWEAAELVAGDSWSLNPAEAFVFGAAALVHDAGLTTLAYEKGREGLRETTLWKDAATGLENGDNEDAILFEVLRGLHAEQASMLCTREWKSQTSGTIYLIDDSELRLSFGETIGRIAHSHHWSPSRVQADLRETVGGSHKLPPSWVVNERKLGCLIRCADAAQVDRTRAPIMAYAALGPSGVSDLHWRAQNKLNRLTRTKDAINFTSSTSFSVDDADAWWVAYDLALLLDREIKSSNAILGDMGLESFAAARVSGVVSPAEFSERVRTTSWRPIDASIKISDPLLMARTLGGRNLYGPSQIVPFRELVQNSVDAVRAKRSLLNAGREMGSVSIVIDHHPSDSALAIVTVDDDGIGMSESTLSTTLVDFGKSFWNSEALIAEFPGLKSKKVSAIGKFGIGFFSVFEISDAVKVASRRYDRGLDNTRVLDFRGLTARPLLREGGQDELPFGVNTRVTLVVRKSSLDVGFQEKRIYSKRYGGVIVEENVISEGLRVALRQMCAFLDVKIVFTDKRNGSSFIHSPDVYGKDGENLLRELGIEKLVRKDNFNPEESLRPVAKPDGDAFGIAALDVNSLVKNEGNFYGYISVGGIVSADVGPLRRSNSRLTVPYIGVIEGETERAARDISSITAPDDVIEAWLKEQISLIDESLLKKSEQMLISSHFYSDMGIEIHLPFAFCKGKFLTAKEVLMELEDLKRVCIPLNFRYDSFLEVAGYNSLTSEFFEVETVPGVFVLGEDSNRLVDEDVARDIKRNGSGRVSIGQLGAGWRSGAALLKMLEKKWGSELECEFRRAPIFKTRIASLAAKRWVLDIARNDLTPTT